MNSHDFSSDAPPAAAFALRHLSMADWARFGVQQIAYIRPVVVNGVPAISIHAADGTPIMAVADGYVTVAEFTGGWGGLIVIEHTVNGQLVATAYAHSWQHAIYVTAGQRVKAIARSSDSQ